ncbi:inorganic phosphate transporter [Candidatus Woesearchaeota archaeon]|nr:inorganic phosphate transporter [Candidatus Woesearchaeota archaeon]
MPDFILVVIAIIIALAFDFGNGLNDAANAIATVVATRVLSLRAAVLMAAIGNFSGVFFFGVAVATTIGKDLIDPNIVDVYIIISGLIGAILWVYGASYIGLPVSASHALIGGFVGSAVVAAGLKAVLWGGLIKIVIFIVVAPLLGMLGGFLFQIIILWISRKANPSRVNKHFKKLQLISAFSYSLSHGANDAQKTMGVITIVLFSAGYLGGEFYVPFWVIMASYTTITLGTLAGGSRVIKTLGLKLTNLKPINGFCAETAGAATIIGCSLAGIPVSTTHVISGSIAGVGSTRRLSAVRWGLARKIVRAWVLTIPASAFVGGALYYVISFFI